MGTGDERRRKKREKARLRAGAIVAASIVKPQRVDISELGAFFQSNDKLKKGQEIILVLGDPDMERWMSLKARVVRIVNGQNGFKWGLGVEFFDVPPRELAMLGEIKRRAKFTLPRVLLLSRDDALSDLVEARLPADRYDIIRITNIKDLKPALENEKVTLVVADIDCEEGILKRIRKAVCDAAVVVITRKATPELRAMAGSFGIYGCLEKPLDPDRFMGAVSQAIQAYRLAAERRWALASSGTKRKEAAEEPPELVARSGVMLRAYNELMRATRVGSHVLIVGETGVGKEIAARLLHSGSDRRNKPFSTADMPTIPPTLMESTLFGHLKGSFTGAHEDRIGLVGEAADGTLFLDEVSLLPFELQPKLLRLLDRREYKQVGGRKTIKTAARLVVATNRDLGEAVKQGLFREDLFNRLNVIQIRIPPLRERSEEDRHELALDIIRQKNKELNTQVARLGAEAYEQLMTYHWPGNVRELVNAIERSLPEAKGDTLEKLDLGPSAIFLSEDILPEDMSITPDYKQKWKSLRVQVNEQLEKNYLCLRVAECQGNVSAAARKAGISREKFYSKMKKHGIVRSDSKRKKKL